MPRDVTKLRCLRWNDARTKIYVTITYLNLVHTLKRCEIFFFINNPLLQQADHIWYNKQKEVWASCCKVCRCMDVWISISVSVCVCVFCMLNVAVHEMSQLNQQSCWWWFVFTAWDYTPAAIWEESQEREEAKWSRIPDTHSAQRKYSKSMNLCRLEWFNADKLYFSE